MAGKNKIENSIKKKQIIEMLKKEVVLALGCTEPIAVALSVCRGREILGAVPDRIELFVSGNIFKNVRDVGIPGCEDTGTMIAAALGALTGHSEDNLELLKNITPQISTQAMKMVKSSKISVSIKENVDKLYIEANCYYKKHKTTVIIEKCHNNIVFVEDDGNIVFVAKHKDMEVEFNEKENKDKLSVKKILEFAQNASIGSIKFILDGVEPNIKISKEGLINDYGLKIGKTLSKSENFSYSTIVTQVAAALDARMAGSLMPVMTNSGSGNQGLTIFIPIVKYAEKIKASKEDLIRGLIFGNLISIHIKKQIGPLSALCGLIPASIGAGCGIMHLENSSFENICSLIKYVIADVSGLFCDGAKPSCALKLISCLNSAFHAIELITNGIKTPFSHGIIDQDIEATINNLATIATNGMNKTDEQILNIMKNACR